MGVPRAFAPTPKFLFQSIGLNKGTTKPLYPDFYQSGIGTPLFNKGRACLAYLLSLFKEVSPDKNEILVPAYNAQSLAFATIYNQLKIKLVDINQNYFFPSAANYIDAISDKTLAAILPYNWGVFPELSELKKITEIFETHNIFWIDDFASSYPLGEYLNYFNENSPCLFFSFGKTKILSLMDGGYAFIPETSQFYQPFSKNLMALNSQKKMFSFNLNDLQKTLVNFFYHLYTNNLGYSILSLLGAASKDRPPKNLKINLQSLSIGWENTLEKVIKKQLEKTLNARLKVNKKYHEQLQTIDPYKTSLFRSTKNNVGSRFPILFESKKMRDKAKRKLLEKNIGVSEGHIKWLKEIELLKPYLKDVNDNDFQESIIFQDRLLTLPTHAKVSENHINIICNVIKQL